MDVVELSQLREYTETRRQDQILDALIETKNGREAAELLGIHERNIWAGLKRVRKQAAKHGFSPRHDLVHPVAPGQRLKGTSTLYHPEKGVAMQWVKTREDEQAQLEALKESAQNAAEEQGRLNPLPPPTETLDADLLNLFVVTDFHLGARSWPEETGDDPWDTDIAEKLLIRWFGKAINAAPNAETAFLAQLGDFLDYDSLLPVTPTSGHIMDADTRYQRLVRVAVKVLRKIIDMLLVKHNRVRVLMAEGNHDLAGSIWLREFFWSLYEDEPRVHVDRSADIYYCYEHGDTSLFFHHGHKKRPRDGIEKVFAAKFREVFGRTKHSYAHMGHLHHVDIKENELMIVEQHRTLAARNAHESRGGWVSGRDAKVITYHREFGRVSEQVISPQMV